MFDQYALKNARDLLEREKEYRAKNEFDGNNWPFYFRMKEFKSQVYLGVKFFPNLKEIDHYEFTQHTSLFGSYKPTFHGTASVEYMEGIKYARYANVFMNEYGYNAGEGVAFVAVPEDPAEWGKSQHYRSEVKHKLRHWSFCLCEHKYRQIAYRRCVTTYQCKECDWTYEVDSSG